MTERANSYDYEGLLTCGRGELFGEGNAQLPAPPMLMFDRITHISDEGGAHGIGKGVRIIEVARSDDKQQSVRPAACLLMGTAKIAKLGQMRCGGKPCRARANRLG